MDLKIENLHVLYHHVTALRGISIDVKSGDFITLIGSNGSGKSTTLRTISGLVKPSRGTVTAQGQRIDGMAADEILKLGIAQVPEGRRIFKDLSVIENLRLGAFTRSNKAEINQDLDRVFQIFPKLQERQGQHARTLSGGEQQMVSIARALMSRPKMLLLDEPSLGLAPIIIREIGKTLMDINRTGVTIILVEQNADLALRLARYGYVLESGRIALEDEAKHLASDDHVKKAYLGI